MHGSRWGAESLLLLPAASEGAREQVGKGARAHKESARACERKERVLGSE